MKELKKGEYPEYESKSKFLILIRQKRRKNGERRKENKKEKEFFE